jgi:hypothetical protein
MSPHSFPPHKFKLFQAAGRWLKAFPKSIAPIEKRLFFLAISLAPLLPSRLS